MLLLAALAHAADPAAAPTFLAGRWEGRAGTETWTRTPSGLVGVGFSGGGFEVLLVKEWEGKLGYVAFPGGSAPTVFHVESVEGETVRFANPTHDDPQVITYRRRGDKLCAEVGTLADPERDRVRWRRGADARVEALEVADRAFAADVAAGAATSGEAAAGAWVSWYDPAGWSWSAESGKVPAGAGMAAEMTPLFSDGALLAWTPTASGLSADGALGFTTGTWRWTGGGETAEGAYVTVWRRQADGSWKVLFDTSG